MPVRYFKVDSKMTMVFPFKVRAPRLLWGRFPNTLQTEWACTLLGRGRRARPFTHVGMQVGTDDFSSILSFLTVKSAVALF